MSMVPGVAIRQRVNVAAGHRPTIASAPGDIAIIASRKDSTCQVGVVTGVDVCYVARVRYAGRIDSSPVDWSESVILVVSDETIDTYAAIRWLDSRANRGKFATVANAQKALEYFRRNGGAR